MGSEMFIRRRRRVVLCLAAVSIVGVLAMHGPDPVVATVDQMHSSHLSDADAGFGDHQAIGLCVFLVAVATLGLASIGRLKGAEIVAKLDDRPRQVTRKQLLLTSAPPLRYRLCVLRL